MDRMFKKSAGQHSRHRIEKRFIEDTDSHGGDEKIGLRELWPGGSDNAAKLETKLDIIAIHGLNGNLYTTWTDGDRLWLRDFLPTAIPEARIFTFGYNAGLAFTRSVSNVDDYARILLERLMAARRKSAGTKRPIVFICHSLGGIVMKKALVIAHERSDRYQSLSSEVYGVIFMGTPHRGADLAFWTSTLSSMADLLTLGAVRTRLLNDLQPKSDTLGDICSQFVERGKNLKIFTMYERLKIKGLSTLVVDEHSTIMHLPNEVPVPIEANHMNICRFSTSSSENYQTVFDCLKELVDDAMQIDQSYITETRTSFVQSLKAFHPEAIVRRLPSPSEGTCTWFTKHSAFRSWQNSLDYRVLWMWGRPGVGKTVMMKHLLQHLRHSFHGRSNSQNILAFFFCDDKDWLRKGHVQLLRSLMDQILSQDTQLIRYLNEQDMEEYNSLLKQDSDKLYEASIDFLRKSLSMILQRSHNVKFWILVDAIDELEPASRKHVLRILGEVAEKDVAYRVKIIFSDRVGPISRSFLQSASVFELDGLEAADDVRSFIRVQTEGLCVNEGLPRKLQSEIESTLIDLSGGIFLHASLVWANFHNGVTYWSPHVVRGRLAAVSKISKDAVSYYCSLLERIPEDSQRVVRKAFLWVLGARKPLSVLELQHAVAIDSGQSSWSDLVGDTAYNFKARFEQMFGYLLRSEQDGKVRLTHQTVKEILVSSPGSFSSENEVILRRFRIPEDKIEVELAKACITVLSFGNFEQDTLAGRFGNLITAVEADAQNAGNGSNGAEYEKKSMDEKEAIVQSSLPTDRYVLLFYCAIYWRSHCEASSPDPELEKKILGFIYKWGFHLFFLVPMLVGVSRIHRAPIWNNIIQHARLPTLHFVMRLGDYPAVVRDLIQQGQDINGLDIHKWTPLNWAVAEGREACVETLLAIDSVNINRDSSMADSPLHLALLTKSGMAIKRKLLQDPRLDINARSLSGWTVLHWAISNRDLELANELLARTDLDILVEDEQGTTYIDYCFFRGLAEESTLRVVNHPNTSAKWFRKLPGTNTTRRSGSVWIQNRSYICIARSWDWRRVEDLILSRDPSQAVSTVADEMSLVEQYAYHGVRDRLVQLLDMLPSNVFHRHTNGRTSLLHLCAQQDWEPIVLQLQEKFGLSGVHVDKRGRTMLHYAVEYQWQSLADLCIGKPVSWLNHQAEDGKTPLHVAVEHRNAVACEILLDSGIDHLIRDNTGKAPIHVAAEFGHRFILKLLLQSPTQEYRRDVQGRTLLHFLVMWESEDVIRRYIDKNRPIIQTFDQMRRTPLHYAAIYSNMAAVKLMLDFGADPGLKDASGSTPLHYALAEGSVQTVKLLHDHGAYLWEHDGYRRNSLQLALRSSNSELLDYIFEILESQWERLKADPRSGKSEHNLVQMVYHTDVFGQTALHRACLLSEDPSLWDAAYDFNDGSSDDFSDDSLYEDGEPVGTTASSNVLLSCIATLRVLGADINAQDKYGATPLHVACKNNNRVAVDALLNFPEIQISLRDNRDCTPLDHSVVQEQVRITDILLRHKAQHSVDFRKKLGVLYRPLHNPTNNVHDPKLWALTLGPKKKNKEWATEYEG